MMNFDRKIFYITARKMAQHKLFNTFSDESTSVSLNSKSHQNVLRFQPKCSKPLSSPSSAKWWPNRDEFLTFRLESKDKLWFKISNVQPTVGGNSDKIYLKTENYIFCQIYFLRKSISHSSGVKLTTTLLSCCELNFWILKNYFVQT